MPVFSHSRKVENNSREGSKLLIDHLKGVCEKALHHFSDRAVFSEVENANLAKMLNAICWLHDLGKFTSYFQTYLLEPEKADWQLKAHSNLGAHTAFHHLKDNPIHALIGFYLIKMHHSNLMNIDEVLYPENSQARLEEPLLFEKQVKSLSTLEEFKSHFKDFSEGQLQLSNPKDLYGHYKNHLRKKPSIERYFYTNYLFSLLIEADKLDASDTVPYVAAPLPENAVDERLGSDKPVFPKKDLAAFSQNELRNFVRFKVVDNLKRDDILQKRIFTLAAPTGIGKTMTSLDFALKLRKKIEVEENYLPQIICGLPFINIIEQALDEYEKTIGHGKIIGHYQYADVFGEDNFESFGASDEERFYSQMRMSWDTWQSDVVVTSFVQLFETLIGNRNKLLKKFRHLADSIIILDEVQTLAIEKLPIIGAALYHLCKFLNARTVIMTATQPKIFELMERELKIQIEDSELQPFNLLPNDSEVFACFHRTKIVPLIQEKVNTENFIKVFDEKWHSGKSCLIVVNKVNRSIELYRHLKKYLYEKNESIELYYLSTNITPHARKKRIEEIKKCLEHKACILISTQVVEAGVDLDFDMGFRDLGPIDSIVQVAGRINRENTDSRKDSPLYVVDFGDCGRIYGPATEIKARKALQKEEIFEKDYKHLVESYFSDVSDNKLANFNFSRQIFDAMQNLRYSFPHGSNPDRKTVSDFKIIEHSQEGVSVFVESPEDETGKQARQSYQKLLNHEIQKHEFDKRYKRNFNQRIIAVPNYIDKVAELKNQYLSENILWVKPEEIDLYYDQETGFIREGKETNQAIAF